MIVFSIIICILFAIAIFLLVKEYNRKIGCNITINGDSKQYTISFDGKETRKYIDGLSVITPKQDKEFDEVVSISCFSGQFLSVLNVEIDKNKLK